MKPPCTCAEGAAEPESTLGVVTVIPRTTFTFHGSTAGMPPPATVIPLRMRIDTGEWTSGVLLVRLHAKTFPSTTSYAEVEVYNDGFTREDPATQFSAPLATRGYVTISNGATAGALYAINTVQPIASMMRVDLNFYQGTTTLGLSKLTLSVVLVGRRRRKEPEARPRVCVHAALVPDPDSAAPPRAIVHRAPQGPDGDKRLMVELRGPQGTDWLMLTLKSEAETTVCLGEPNRARAAPPSSGKRGGV